MVWTVDTMLDLSVSRHCHAPRRHSARGRGRGESGKRPVGDRDLGPFLRSRASRKEERRRLFFAHQPLFVQTASLAARGLLFLLFVGLCRRPITIVIINSNCLLTTPRHDRSFCAVRRDGVAGAARQPRAPWPRAGAARPRPPDDEHQSLMSVVVKPEASV